MPLDALLIAAVAFEINSILPVKIDRIHQPHPDEFIFSCYGMGQSFKLYCSLNSRYHRIHLFEGAFENPVNPPPFCMLLRKHFSGAKLINVRAVPFERIVRLTFETYEELIGLTNKIIMLELTGKSSNLIITNENGIIIDFWRKTGSGKGQERELAVGGKYELPPTGGRWQPVTVSPEEFVLLAGQVPPEAPVEKFLLKHWYGLSTMTINEITRTAGIAPDTPCGRLTENALCRLYDSFQNWAELIKKESFAPCCLYAPGEEPVDCSGLPVRFPEAGLSVKPVRSLSRTIAAIYGAKQETEHFQMLKNSLLKKIYARLEKARLKLNKQEQEAAQAEQGEQWRIMGELLTVYGSQIPKGSAVVNLINHYDPENREIEIPLNPALTVWENAQSYFKKYQKAKKGQLAIAAQIAKTQENIDYLDSLATMIHNAMSLSDLRLVQEELELSEEKSGHAQNRSSKKQPPAKPRQFLTPSGHLLLVGRNNLQNDRLTFKIADQSDWWFHAQKIPGSHVILRPKPGTPVDDETLNLACQLAVYFSKARESTKVPVDYTQRKYVKKPPAAKPGFVIYDNFKTAIITPDQELLETLEVSKEMGTNSGS